MSTDINAVLAILGARPFFVIAVLTAIVLVAAILYGATRWQQPIGMAIALVAGLLLLLLAVLVVVIFFLARSGAWI